MIWTLNSSIPRGVVTSWAIIENMNSIKALALLKYLGSMLCVNVIMRKGVEEAEGQIHIRQYFG
jgi:hypothetical protein